LDSSSHSSFPGRSNNRSIRRSGREKRRREKRRIPVRYHYMSTSATVTEEESEDKLNGREKMVGSTEVDRAISSSNEFDKEN